MPSTMSGEGYLQRKVGFATAAIHGGNEPEKWNCRAVVPGIFTSTTYKQDAPAEHRGYEYARSNNPTREAAEQCLAAIEGAKHCMTFASGLGATTALAGLLNQGDHMVAMDDLYGGTYRYFSKVLSRMGVEISFVDARDPAKVASAMRPNTKMVWIETPTNPLLKVADIQAVCKVAHSQQGVIVVVDNTFFTCYNQKPLTLGADIVMYSLTKYMNGHSDVIMGAALMNDDKLHESLRFLQNAMGIVPSPFDCSQLNRSLKTLPLRMERHMNNGLLVGQYLEKHPLVEKVLHPGLPSHPQHDLIKKQCYGVSGMLSFYIKGGLQESRKFLSSLKVFTLAESLGGYESLAELPSVMTHASIPPEQRAELGITDSLIRLSVGLEDAEDLIADLEQALKAAVSK
ncbi:cystathionine gamma-lyase [Thrips palmi]|uniref:cystathionine gamma-lyase n=1 Tax=Thrips palmi TaxID=161013 RepID=A0A6P8YNI1_THRPL|nr:cystathionine gamma-lyase [Thrips palmi]